MSDNEIKVLLTADLASLQEGMTAGADTVKTNTEAMAAAAEESAAAIQEAQAAIADSVGAAAQAVQASMEETAAVITGANRQTTESVTAEAAAFNAAVQAKIDAQVRLNAAFAGSVASTSSIAEAEAALDQAMAAGALTAAEYSAYIDRLNIAEVEMAASTEAATVATEENTAAMVLNGGVARELGVMVGELARGNYTRLEGSTITLANRTNVLSSVLQGLMSPIGLATIGAAALGYEVYAAGDNFRAMDAAVTATGDASGLTAGQLALMADEVGRATGNAKGAEEAFAQLAQSGRFAGNDLQLVGQAAAEMATMTGQSVQSIIAQIDKLQQDPLQAVAKLNDQFHFLTVAEYEQMEQLVASGNRMDAARIAYEAMANTMSVRTSEVESRVNILIRGFRDLKNVWNDTMQSANVALGGGDTAQQLEDAKRVLKNLQEQNAALLQVGSNSPGLTENLRRQTAVVNELTEQLKKEAAATATVGQAAQQTAAQIDAMAKAHPEKRTGGSADNKQAQADRDQFNNQRLQHTMSLSEERQFWEQKREAAAQGTQAYRQAVQQILDIRQRQATAARSAARQEEADARQVAAEKVRATRSASREQQIAQQQERRLGLENLQASHDEASGAIETKRQQYRAEYAEGQISAQQLLQLERQLATERLAIDTRYYQAKARLDASDAVAVVRDESAIVKAQQTMQQQMARAEQEFHRNSLKSWKNHAKKIEGAMQGAINGMLFQHQTLRQGVASIALVIGEDFIQQAVMKPLDKWIAAEVTKVSASVSTSTALEAQRVADTVAEAAHATASVVRAAGVAGANGLASFAAAPWPIDMGAPVFGASMAAAALSFAPVASAAGGWERVPFDGAMTELHKDEMVLPKHIAEPMRQMAKRGANGGKAGGGDVHIHAMDARSFKEALRRNQGDLMKVARHAARRGH